jgi:hypothetical protein
MTSSFVRFLVCALAVAAACAWTACAPRPTHPDSLRLQRGPSRTYTDIPVAPGKTVSPLNILEVVPIQEGAAGYVLFTRDRQSMELTREEMGRLEMELVKQDCSLVKPQPSRMHFGFGVVIH